VVRVVGEQQTKGEYRMRYDAKLKDIIQTSVMLNQVGDNVMSMLDAIEKRLRKGGVSTEVWLDDEAMEYEGRLWSLGFARFEGRFRLAVREQHDGGEPTYATPLKHSPRLLRLRAAGSVGGLLDLLLRALQEQANEAAAAAQQAEQALGGLALPDGEDD
jgi:hypothetical protein